MGETWAVRRKFWFITLSIHTSQEGSGKQPVTKPALHLLQSESAKWYVCLGWDLNSYQRETSTFLSLNSWYLSEQLIPDSDSTWSHISKLFVYAKSSMFFKADMHWRCYFNLLKANTEFVPSNLPRMVTVSLQNSLSAAEGHIHCSWENSSLALLKDEQGL